MKTKSWFRFFDKLEDKVRESLSRVPIIYGFIGGVGVVLFWRGVWHTADMLVPYFFRDSNPSTLFIAQTLDAPITILISSLMLLLTGLVVSSFIGTNIIISGIRHERKVEEKEVQEIKSEDYILHSLSKDIKKLNSDIEEIKNKLTNR